MGMEQSVYIGPYAEFVADVVNERIDRCKRPNECPDPTGEFCPKCGIRTNKRFEDLKVAAPSHNEVSEFCVDEMEEALDMMDYPAGNVVLYVFVPNWTPWYNLQKRKHVLDNYVLRVEDWSKLSVKDEMNEFARTFDKQIWLLHERFSKPVSVKWGLVQRMI